MNKFKFSIVLGVMLFSFIQAQTFSLISQSDFRVEFQHDLAPFESSKTSINGVEHQNFSKTHNVVTHELGAPALPFFSQAIQVPQSGNVSYEVHFDSFYDIDNIEIAPSKGELKRNVNPDTIPYTFGEVYQKNEFYPGELSNMSEPHILRSTRGVTISLYPYQYNPVQKKLRVYENLRIVVKTDTSTTGVNELERANVQESKMFQDIYENIYLNKQTPSYTMASEIGSMLIIADESFVDELAPLIEWKIQSGIKTEVVTTADTGNTAASIKSFIQSYYQDHPDLTFLLLVGDSDRIPSYSYGISSYGENLWSDTYYAQLVGGNNDYFPEILVGRLSGNENDIVVMVNRILEYEKNPSEGNWMKNAIGLGSNEGAGIGDDGESDYQHLRNIRTQLQGFGYERVFELYEGSQGGEDATGNPNAMMVKDAINSGVGLFNYTGHGDVHLMVTGNFTSSNVNQLTNTGQYPFVVSVACNNGTFVNATTIGEVFLRANNGGSPTGAIAFAGSSILMAWTPPMETQDEMTNILTKVYENQEITSIGGLFYNAQIGMLTAYDNSYLAKEVMQTWILFGDPSVIFRYDITQEITADHAPSVAANANSFEITTCNTDGALATMSQDGIILGKAYISGSSVVIEFEEQLDANGSDPVLTITKQNHKPYQASVAIGDMGIADLNLNSIQVYPIPAKEVVNIFWNKSQKISQIDLKDMTGRTLKSEKLQSNLNSHKLNVSSLPKGVYVLTLKLDGKEVNKKIIVN